MPLVSIIMNIRNGAAYLRQALDSVLTQTFNDWELIAWDDCSTDHSSAIVGAYADRRIRYFLATEETALGQARNSAIQQARGEWLAFLDQDDIWLPGKLEKQIALVDADTGIIYGRTLLLYPNGRRRDYDYAHEFMPLPEGEIFTELFAKACFIAMSSAVLRRSAVEQIGGIPKTIELVPDYFLYAAIARRFEARAVQEVVCLYRMHAGNMSHTHNPRLYTESLSVINQWADCLDARVVGHRRMTYSTVLALEEMRSLSSFRSGLERLIKRGSIGWLLQRPFVRSYRALRRTVQHPYWQKVSIPAE